MDVFTKCVADSDNTGGSEVRIAGNGKTITLHLDAPHRVIELDVKELRSVMQIFSTINRTAVITEPDY